MGHRGLKAKRMLMGVTQQEISKEIGIACKTYNLKENGVNDFKLSEVSKISKYLDLSAQEIKDIFILDIEGTTEDLTQENKEIKNKENNAV